MRHKVLAFALVSVFSAGLAAAVVDQAWGCGKDFDKNLNLIAFPNSQGSERRMWL